VRKPVASEFRLPLSEAENYGTGKDVSDESIADAGEPLRVKWHNDSYVNVPVSDQRSSTPGSPGDRFDQGHFFVAEQDAINAKVLPHVLLVRCTRERNHADLHGETKNDLHGVNAEFCRQ